MMDDEINNVVVARKFRDFPWDATVRHFASGGYLKKHPDRMLFIERNKEGGELYVGEIVGHGTWGEKLRKSKLDDLEEFDPELHAFCLNMLVENPDYFS